MGELKLGKLPDRTPIRLSISVSPDLHQSLQDYAGLYAQTYGHDEPVSELIPAMLKSFLESDRAFNKTRNRT